MVSRFYWRVVKKLRYQFHYLTMIIGLLMLSA